MDEDYAGTLCNHGERVVSGLGGNLSCVPCPTGHFSKGGAAESCTTCSPGDQLPPICSSIFRHIVVHAGYFQPEQGQFGCISCDLGLGDAFQELSGQSSCHACAAHTRRYIGVLGAANQSACRCKEGSSTLFAVSFRGGFRVLTALVCRILQLGRHSWGGALVACTSSHRH